MESLLLALNAFAVLLVVYRIVRSESGKDARGLGLFSYMRDRVRKASGAGKEGADA